MSLLPLTSDNVQNDNCEFIQYAEWKNWERVMAYMDGEDGEHLAGV
jgi:hypothetical protein